MARERNKNDSYLRSVSELSNEIEYETYQYKELFIYLCDLIPNIEKEKIEVNGDLIGANLQKKDLVYIIVVCGKIFKIGHTINNIHKRVESYNCGKERHREKGTCSTTNFFILQSLLHINRISRLYAYFPIKKEYEIFGEVGEETFPSTKTVKKKILKDFQKRYGRLPLGCTQS